MLMETLFSPTFHKCEACSTALCHLLTQLLGVTCLIGMWALISGTWHSLCPCLHPLGSKRSSGALLLLGGDDLAQGCLHPEVGMPAPSRFCVQAHLVLKPRYLLALSAVMVIICPSSLLSLLFLNIIRLRQERGYIYWRPPQNPNSTQSHSLINRKIKNVQNSEGKWRNPQSCWKAQNSTGKKFDRNKRYRNWLSIIREHTFFFKHSRIYIKFYHVLGHKASCNK